MRLPLMQLPLPLIPRIPTHAPSAVAYLTRNPGPPYPLHLRSLLPGPRHSARVHCHWPRACDAAAGAQTAHRPQPVCHCPLHRSHSREQEIVVEPPRSRRREQSVPVLQIPTRQRLLMAATTFGG